MTEAITTSSSALCASGPATSEDDLLHSVTSVVMAPDYFGAEFDKCVSLPAPLALFLAAGAGSCLDEYLIAFENLSFESFEAYLSEVMSSATDSDTSALLDRLWELASKLGYTGSNILKSLACYEAVYEYLCRKQPGNYSSIARVLSALAECWDFLGNSRKAMDYFKQAAEVCQAGDGHFAVMDLCYFENAACALFDFERYSDARPFAQKCLSGREQLLGRCHLLTIMSLRMLLRIEIGIKRHGKVGRALEKDLAERFQELAQVQAETGDTRLADTLAAAARVPRREAMKMIDQTFEELLIELVESGSFTEAQSSGECL